MALVDSVRANGGAVRIFSTLHTSGQQLALFSGVAAVLRFPLPDVAAMQHETSSSEDEAEGAEANGDGGDGGGAAAGTAARD